MIDELPRIQRIILKNYANNATNLPADVAALFEQWNLQITQHDMMKLAPEGENEMIDLGERYQARFPSLMPEAYSNETYKVCLIKYLTMLYIFSLFFLIINSGQ